jgi:hypothetical protein
VATVLAVTSAWSVALAQDDCLSGFNCGRTAWIENLEASSGDAMQYRIELRNSGPDAAPAVDLIAVSEPALLEQAWTCEALGGAACPAASGSGDIATTIDLPAGAGLDFIVSGTLPADLPPQVQLVADAIISDQDPHFVFDVEPANNTAVATPAELAIFADGFEAD